MLGAFFSALSGLQVASRKVSVSANNLANAQTTGFKKSVLEVADLAQGGARVAAVSRADRPAAVMVTDSPIDLAINGGGYFQVQLPGGATGYSRAGNFRIDSRGRLSTANGEPLQPQINVPPGATALTIDSQGEVTATVGGQPQVIGQLALASFNNPAGLRSVGGNVLIESSASGRPTVGQPGTGGRGDIISGAQELSNVDFAEEAVSQMVAKFAFKANINVIRVADQMMGSLLDRKA